MIYCAYVNNEKLYCACVGPVKIYCAYLDLVKIYYAYICLHMTNCACARQIRIPIEVHICNLPIKTITTIPYMPHVYSSLP